MQKRQKPLDTISGVEGLFSYCTPSWIAIRPAPVPGNRPEPVLCTELIAQADELLKPRRAHQARVLSKFPAPTCRRGTCRWLAVWHEWDGGLCPAAAVQRLNGHRTLYMLHKNNNRGTLSYPAPSEDPPGNAICSDLLRFRTFLFVLICSKFLTMGQKPKASRPSRSSCQLPLPPKCA